MIFLINILRKSSLFLCLCYSAFFFNANAQELNFDSPAIEEKKESGFSTQLGPISNLTLGGAVDWRLVHVNGSKRPVAFLHVNEFVVTANVGNHVSVSAEQLLLTSEVSSVVGQDHGFVTISLVQLPFLPKGVSLKLGRFRGKFGIDAQLDSPANIFPSQALRSNGFVTDVGLNIDYALGAWDWVVEIFNGPDYKVMNGQKLAALSSKPAVQSRLVYQPMSSLKLGLSALYGETFNNQVDPRVFSSGMLGSRLDADSTIVRRRMAFDMSVKIPWAEIYAEGIYGRDEGRLAQPVDKGFTFARGHLARVDVPLWRISNETSSKFAIQYDSWQDASFDGRVAYISAALSILNDEGWTYRIGGSANDMVFRSSRPSYIHDAPWSTTTQFLVSF